VDEGESAIYTLRLDGNAVQFGETAAIDIALALLGSTSLPDFAESLYDAVQEAIEIYNNAAGTIAGSPNSFSVAGHGSLAVVTFHGNGIVSNLELLIDLNTFDDAGGPQKGHAARLREPNESFQLLIQSPRGTVAPNVLNLTPVPVRTTIIDDDTGKWLVWPMISAARPPQDLPTMNEHRARATTPDQALPIDQYFAAIDSDLWTAVSRRRGSVRPSVAPAWL
jgi:hypothetical protein